MDIKKLSRKGAIVGKQPIMDIFNKHKTSMFITALIKESNAHKYKRYSWFNTPESSDSTVINNLNALYRHFSAHTMGAYIDVEGLPHVWHMMCRASMAIGVLYKDLDLLNTFIDSKDLLYEKNLCTEDNLCHQIVPTDMVALIKNPDPAYLTDNISQMTTAINTVINNCFIFYSNYTKPSPHDLLVENQLLDDLYTLISHYLQLHLNKFDYIKILNHLKSSSKDDELLQSRYKWIIPFVEKYIYCKS